MAVEFNARVMSDGWLKVAVWYVPTTSRRKEAEVYIDGDYYGRFFVPGGETGDYREFNVNRDFNYGKHSVEVKFDGSWIRHEDGDWEQYLYFGGKNPGRNAEFGIDYDPSDYSLKVAVWNVDSSDGTVYATVYLDSYKELGEIRVRSGENGNHKYFYLDDERDGEHRVTVEINGDGILHEDGGYRAYFTKKTIEPPGPKVYFYMEYRPKTEEIYVRIFNIVDNGNRLNGKILCDGKFYHSFTTTRGEERYTFTFDVSDLGGGDHTFAVFIEGTPVPDNYGNYNKTLNTGPSIPGDEALFDASYDKDTELLKVAVWDVNTGKTSLDIDVYVDGSYIGYFEVPKGANGSHDYFSMSKYPEGNHTCSVKANGKNIKTRGGVTKVGFYIPERGVKSIKLISVDWGDYAPTVHFYADNSGYVDLYSKTRGTYIKKNLWVEKGTGSYEFSNSEVGWLDGRKSMPAGTCYFSKNGVPLSHNPDVFYAVRQFEFTNFSREYEVDIQRRSYNAIELTAVTNDWILLINGLYYISSAIDGYFGDVNYSNFFPSAGKVITASMYNTLIDITEELGRKINYGSGIPNKVRKEEVISRNFIRDIGDVYNVGIKYLQTKNSSLGR